MDSVEDTSSLSGYGSGSGSERSDALISLQQQIDKLVIQKNKLENEILKNKAIETEYKIKAILYDNICERNSIFKNKILFAFSFLDCIGKDSCIYGSFVRKIFDYSLRFNKLKNINTGSFENSDINIIFMNSNTDDKIKVTSDFYKFIHHLECIQILNIKKTNNTVPINISLSSNIATNENVNNEKNPIKINIESYCFYKYSYRSKKEISTYDNNGKLVPRFLLEFHKIIDSGNNEIISKYDVIRVNLIAWRPIGCPEFSINSFFLNHSGIFTNNKFSSFTFTEYLTNISNSEAVFIKNLKEIQDLAFPEDNCLPREVKKKFLNQLYKNIAQPYLKVLDNDFEIKGIIPSIQFEKEEDCPLTGFSFPYPTVKLECNHKISLMAYKGIVNNDLDSTEAIRCPYCRQDLKINFKYDRPLTTINPNLKLINFNMTVNENFRKRINNNIISNDAINHL